MLIFDTAGIDFLSEELLLEIFHVIRTLMLKKSRILKEFGSVSFCFIVLGVKLCWWVFYLLRKTSLSHRRLLWIWQLQFIDF